VYDEDRFERLNAQGPPFGISPSLISDPPLKLELSPNDMIILTTDGFFEWGNPREELFGLHRLEEAIRDSREKTPPELISDLYRAVAEFSGGVKQQDDLTAVIIKRMPNRSSKLAPAESAAAALSPRVLADQAQLA
jgi:serine phosphatase RsbU (regulator of sigma subunit)